MIRLASVFSKRWPVYWLNLKHNLPGMPISDAFVSLKLAKTSRVFSKNFLDR